MKSKYLTILFIPESGEKQRQISISVLTLFIISFIVVGLLAGSIIALINQYSQLKIQQDLEDKYSILLRERLSVNELLGDLNKIKYLDKQIRKTLTDDLNLEIPILDSDELKTEKIVSGFNLGSIPSQKPVSGYLTQKMDISSGFQLENHYGIDISAAEGTPVTASAGGMVVFSGWSNDLGNHIILYHGDGYFTQYGHLSDVIAVSREMVGVGEPIAHVGSTGISSGPHLHFEIWRDGAVLDPLDFFPQYKENDLSSDLEK